MTLFISLWESITSLWDESFTVNKVVFVIESSVFIFTAKMITFYLSLFDLLATEKSQYFGQPHPIIVNPSLVTRTLKGNKKQFKLAGDRVIGVDRKIQFAMLKNDSWGFSALQCLVQCKFDFFHQKR